MIYRDWGCDAHAINVIHGKIPLYLGESSYQCSLIGADGIDIGTPQCEAPGEQPGLQRLCGFQRPLHWARIPDPLNGHSFDGLEPHWELQHVIVNAKTRHKIKDSFFVTDFFEVQFDPVPFSTCLLGSFCEQELHMA